MNEPRVPDNDRDWKEIDIFLFTNGQQYSPPRKYHLKSDDLELWEATTRYLARTQYGSMHSNIDLYTLDGKKIVSPLELRHATSYVAVTPPDAFIPAGYERYLIKASRSWEKRQEKLANMADTTGELKVIREHSKTQVDELKTTESPNMQDSKNIMEKDVDSIGTNNTIISRIRKENESSLDEKPKEYKPFTNRKSVDSVKNKGLIKNLQQISNNSKDESILNKKRNISVPKNFKYNSTRRQSISMKNDKNNTKMNVYNSKDKTQANATKIPEGIEVKDKIAVSKPSSLNGNQYHETSNLDSDKGLLFTSDVYKNPESEAQSMYIDADRKVGIFKDKYKSSDLHKIVELNDDLVNSLKANKAISVQSMAINKHGPDIGPSFSNRAKVFNIKLSIEVRDDRDSVTTDKSGHLVKCISHTALLTAEQGSQANVNINLNDDDFKYDNIPNRKSFYSEKNIISDVSDKIIIRNCACGSEAHNIIEKCKEKYVLLVPSVFVDKNAESYRCSPDHHADKETTKSHPILNSEPPNQKINAVSRENSQAIIKHKVSISPDSPIKISAEIHSGLGRNIFNVPNPVARTDVPNPGSKTDQTTQTEWCNILLQARPEADGRSSFHLPPLRVLAQYNLL